MSIDVPVPGGTVALSRAISLETTPDPARFAAELIRVVYTNGEGGREQAFPPLLELDKHLAAAERLQSAIDAMPAGVSLASAAARGERERLEELLALLGYRLRQTRGRAIVQRDTDRAAQERAALLSDLGVAIDGVDDRLNNGETVRISLPTELVPIPLDADTWSRVVFKAPVAPAHLFAAILSNGRASLLCHGLAALDDETLEYLSAHPLLLARLYEEHAPLFASFASQLRISGGRVVLPGGDEAAPLWESLLEERAANPERFVLELLSRQDGRLAYLFDTVGELDSPQQAFVLGLWIADPRARIDRFHALAAVIAAAFPEWQTRSVPFRRPAHDLAELALAVRVNAQGVPRGLPSRRFWARALEGVELPADPDHELRETDGDGIVDAAWLAETCLPRREREQLLRQLAFGFRAFADAAPPLGDVMLAIRAAGAYPSLVLTVERIGAPPSLYVALARQAHRVDQLEGDRLFVAMRQFQGAVALVARITLSGAIDAATARSLLQSLAAVPLDVDGRYRGRIAAWIAVTLMPAIEPRDTAEEAIVAALSGATRSASAAARPIEWEGERYRVDVPAAEQRRMRTVRERQGSLPFDVPLELHAIANALASRDADLAGVQSAAVRLTALLALLPAKSRGGTVVQPPGLAAPMNAHDTVDRAVKELEKISRPRDAKKGSEIAESLAPLTDVLLGEALAAMLYAADLGDPDGPTLLGADVSRRHDFGFREVDSTRRQRVRWARPVPEVEMETPWHLRGSLLGLDVALGRLSMKRVDLEMPLKPALPSNDREGFLYSYALINAHTLRDADAAAISASIARGGARVDAVTDEQAAAALAADVQMDGWRTRALRWTVRHDRARARSYFALPELMILGGQHDLSAFDAWGSAGTSLNGCFCLALAPSHQWRLLSGRQQLGVMAIPTPDLTLRIAVLVNDLHVPAVLAKTVAAAAMLNYVDSVRPNHPDDWLTVARGAGELTREQVEDYVAAAAADGPLIPVDDDKTAASEPGR